MKNLLTMLVTSIILISNISATIMRATINAEIKARHALHQEESLQRNVAASSMNLQHLRLSQNIPFDLLKMIQNRDEIGLMLFFQSDFGKDFAKKYPNPSFGRILVRSNNISLKTKLHILKNILPIWLFDCNICHQDKTKASVILEVVSSLEILLQSGTDEADIRQTKLLFRNLHLA